MTLIRDPFDQLEQIIDQMRRSMGRLDAEDLVFPGPIAAPFVGRDINLSIEPVEDGYVVFADLPGFEKDEIDLRYANDVLSISARKSSADEDDLVIKHRKSEVFEEITIPGTVHEDDISASYRNGVLEVHLPTAEKPEAGRVIDID